MTSTTSPFHRFVDRFQRAALAAVAVAVVCLFALGKDQSPAVTEAGAEPGAAVFADRCASCHGAEGQGGGIGPPLAGVVEANFPDVGDQIAVVTNGQGRMPAFADQLSSDEIAAVVEFTRTSLG